MALVKQNVDISFGRGLETKTDPWRVPVGNFLTLEDMVFTTKERLTKRNGYGSLTTLPQAATYLTTFNRNLIAVGTSLQALPEATNVWVNKGPLQPVTLEVMPLIRSNTNQSQVDTAISNDLVCTVYTDQTPTNLSTPRYRYAIASLTTGQNVVAPTNIPVSSGTVTGSPRVFVLGAYFVIVFTNVITATSHIQYVAISTSNPTIVTSNVDIASSYDSSPGLSWDGAVIGTALYIVYNTSAGGQAIKARYLTSTLSLSNTLTYSNLGKVTATNMSVSADQANDIIYASYYDSVSNDGYTLAFDRNLNKVITIPVKIINNLDIANITSVAASGVTTVFYETNNNYGYDSSIPTHFVTKITVTQGGSVGSPSLVTRSVGLASKAFISDSNIYFVGAYQSTYQPSYFLFNSSGKIISRYAYSNGGGYALVGLPSVTVNDNVVQVAYLIKDFITSQNTSTVKSITKSNIYSQTGINLITFTLGTSSVVPAEIAQTLSLSGGFLWEYDGYSPVENNFFVWPDDVEGSPVNSGGAMPSQTYEYQVVYTWTNNQGNIERSAPSIATTVDMSSSNLAFTPPTPITFTGDVATGSALISNVSSFTGIKVGQYITDTTTGGNLQANSYIVSFDNMANTITLNLTATGTGTTDNFSISSINSVTLHIPTLRLTYKTANPVKIEIFRFSTAQQEFFQVTSIQQPLINDTTVDYVTYTDTAADNQILGNSLIYTTGGVVENIGAPSFNALTLFDNRLWGITAEDPNLLWFSKQVVETTPVDMSDLFTRYVAPSTASQGSTGNMKCLAPMDDKLIIFKPNALYYINGTGPDNTGANSQYSEPIFITSVVGSSNQQSIVFMPDGLMFQSDKGIWLLGRGMSVSYIGAPVEAYTKDATVQSAVCVSGTTQVRFTLDSGLTLMYDYFFQQWGTFTINAISSTLYQDKHTYLDSFGRVFQETPDLYIDGTIPVTWKFTTSWINLAGLQGYQRAYFFYLLGQYITPHFLNVGIAYDYDPAIVQSTTITPANFSPAYGVSSPYGQQTPYGFPGDVEQWRIFFANQRCQAFQLTIQEIYDSSLGVAPGQGLTLSGLNLLVSAVRPFRAGPVLQSAGGGTNGSNN